jgi:hypothetical protein
MTDIIIHDLAIVFVIYGPNEPYDYTWTAKIVDKTFTLDYKCSPALIGLYGEGIELELIEAYSFTSENNITIQNLVRFKFDVSSQEPSESSKTSSNAIAITFLISAGISIGVSLVTGGSIELMWSFANTLQIMFFFRLISLSYSSDLKAVFDFMSYSNFENPFGEYLIDAGENWVTINGSPINDNFYDTGFTQTNIIVNSIDKLLIIMLMIGTIFVIFLLLKFFNNSEHKFTKFLIKQDIGLRYSSILRFMYELVLYLSVSCLVTIYYGNCGSIAHILSQVVAFCILIVLLLLLLYSIIFPVISIEIINFDNEDLKRHKLMFEEFNTQKIEPLLFYSYFTFRRILLAAVLVLLVNAPRSQILSIVLLNAWILKYHLCKMPFKDKLTNVISCINEMILFLFSIMLFHFLNPENTQRINRGSYICIGILAVFMIINWGIIFPVMIIKFIKVSNLVL